MKVGILGAGNIAKSMATAINGLGSDIEAYAVASRDLEKSQAFAKEWGFKKAFGSYEEMLADKDLDLVYVATPHSHHYEHTKMCIEAGKAALVEKSFTANAKQAIEILKLAEEKKVLVTEAIWTRYMPSRTIINDIIDSGLIGNVYRVEANLSYPISNTLRMTEPSLAGGTLLDLGVYPINFASMVMGDDIESISGICSYCDTGVDCQENITMMYKDGRMAILTASMMTASHRFGLIFGDKGYINCTNINNIEKIEVFDADHNLIKEVPVPKQINGYEYEVLACQKALKEGLIECEEMPHSETIKIMEWMDSLRNDWGVKYPFE